MNSVTDLLSKSRLYPVLVLDNLISPRWRRLMMRLSRSIILFLIIIFALYLGRDYLPAGLLKYLNLLILLKNKILGLLFINLSFFVTAILLEIYFSSFYYLELIAQNRYRPEDIFTMTVGRIFYRMKDENLLAGFLRSDIGQQIMWRLGIGQPEIDRFLLTSPAPVSAMLLVADNGSVIKLSDLTKFIYGQSQPFRDWLLNYSAKEEEFLGAANWVILGVELMEWQRRWWELDNLTRTPSIARDWSYGGTYNLDQFSRDLLQDSDLVGFNNDLSLREDELRQVESILSRGHETNVLLVGQPSPDKMNLIYSLSKMIKEGRAVPALAAKRPILLETSLVAAACKERNLFEQTIIKIFTEAVQAGNILLIVDDLANLVSLADQYGTNIISVIDPFLISHHLQVIALCDTDNFHRLVENRIALMERFDKVIIEDLPEQAIAEMLLKAVWKVESNFGIFFTYQAVKQIAQGASYYFSESLGSDKAIDLLSEIAPWSKMAGLQVIDASAVKTFIQNKTNIPIGEVTAKEKDKLLNLEKILSSRIVGQREAVVAVASAVRRSRAGVRNPNKPIGTFLFLGPTGVGKTETAKALAATFFNSEAELYRLDMSEYQGIDAIDKLIGSFSTGQPGVLSTMVREHPYGVFLLDEFEKTVPAVLNLFLPILDEGFFSDMNGKRINVRNIIFIATSNAGADLIWNLIEKNQDQKLTHKQLIDAIVERGIFKPELLNRFDATVMFRPLEENELLKISEIQLKKLAKRLEEKGIVLQITPDLIKTVAVNGADKVFGARPMIRYVQEKIEQAIADKMIAGEVVAGSEVFFEINPLSPADLAIKSKKR